MQNLAECTAESETNMQNIPKISGGRNVVTDNIGVLVHFWGMDYQKYNSYLISDTLSVKDV